MFEKELGFKKEPESNPFLHHNGEGMTEENFLYWLQGFFELRVQKTPLTSGQVSMILRHLMLVRTSKGGQLSPSLEQIEQAFKIVDRSGRPEQLNLKAIESAIQKDFVRVTAPGFVPDSYEPLGDAYDNQRLC